MTENQPLINVGTYLSKLKQTESSHTQNWIFSGIQPESNYENYANRETLEQALLNVLKNQIASNNWESPMSHDYLKEIDKFIFSTRFMLGSDINSAPEYPVDIGDKFILKDCPICGEDHLHKVKYELVLGGVAEYTSKCASPIAPETYYLQRNKYCLGRLPGDLVVAAKLWAMENPKPLEELLVPDRLSYEMLAESSIHGWGDDS